MQEVLTGVTEPVLSVRNLTVRLPRGADRENAIEGISFDIGPREIVCIVGESGSGKSVTAQAVMGLLPKRDLVVTAGETLLQGEDTTKARISRLRELRGTRMGMIFQEPMTALNPVQRVGQQVAEVLEIHTDLGSSEQRKRVLDIMRAVQLPDPDLMIDAYPHQLSGGQRQRIMIAAALVLDPALLIADEPTTALDVTTQAQILRLIKEMQSRRNTGVMFITHDFGVVSEIADRVVVMQHGRVVEQGTRDEVLRRPREAYTKMLVAAVPSLVPPKRAPVEGKLALEVKQLSKIYGRRTLFNRKARIVKAAQDVNFHIRKGETLGIVGESGSGKTTVARCIARLIEPTEGDILIDAANVAHLPERELRPYRRDIQIVFQDPYRSLNPRRTVGQSIVEGPINFGMGEDKALEKARELMRLVGLSPDALDRYPHQFSGGQRQRICIARALAMGPTLLIADEAVSALDVSVQAQVLELLDNIRKQFDLAVLFITHDLRVAAQICDRIAVMKNGVVVEHGTTADVFRSPQHEYTKALFDAAPGRNFGAQQSVA
ncbi:MAG TPA: ABC transporter ATP-binding protein [Hyphomicrobiaceae bacterium]|nr:ABC transporter ATP-binding protein [Hyphomicrobiaceae bacterium]